MPFTDEELQSLADEQMSGAVYLAGETSYPLRYDEPPQSCIYFVCAGVFYAWPDCDEWSAISYDEAFYRGLVYGPPLPPKVDPDKPIGKSSSQQGATMRYWIVYADRSYEPIAKAKWINLSLPEVSM